MAIPNLIPTTNNERDIIAQFAKIMRLRVDDFPCEHITIKVSNEPATPKTGTILYCDKTDGRLKVKGSNGTITTLALP